MPRTSHGHRAKPACPRLRVCAKPPPVDSKPSLTERLKAMLNEYGPILVAVYLVIYVVTVVGFAIALTQGTEVEGTAGAAGLWAGAWVAAKLTQPIRVLVTLAVTPVVGALRDRIRGRRALPPPSA